MNTLSKLTLAVCGAATLAVAVAPTPASAWGRRGYGGFGGGYYGGGYGRGFGYGRGYGYGGFGLGFGSGAVLGFGLGALAAPAYYPPPVYYAPPPVVYAAPPVYLQAPATVATPGSCYAGAYVCPLTVAIPAGAQCYCPGHEGRVFGRAG